MKLSGTHPVLYATAGKHHSLHGPEALAYACNCGPLGRCGSVLDRADGAGPHVVPSEVRHAPGFYPEPKSVSSAGVGVRRLRTHAPVRRNRKTVLEHLHVRCPQRAGPGHAFADLGRSASSSAIRASISSVRVFAGASARKRAVTGSVAEALSWPTPSRTGSARRSWSASCSAPRPIRRPPERPCFFRSAPRPTASGGTNAIVRSSCLAAGPTGEGAGPAARRLSGGRWRRSMKTARRRSPVS